MDYAKKKPLLARKPSVVVAIGEKLDKAPPMEKAEGLTCPKCGMEMADTPENAEYVKGRAAEPAEETE